MKWGSTASRAKASARFALGVAALCAWLAAAPPVRALDFSFGDVVARNLGDYGFTAANSELSFDGGATDHRTPSMKLTWELPRWGKSMLHRSSPVSRSRATILPGLKIDATTRSPTTRGFGLTPMGGNATEFVSPIS